jgi:ferredoxin--NADP+ reductase
VDSKTHVHAEIVTRRDLAPDLWTIRIRLESPLVFRPGQFATIGVSDGETMIERPYSIVSSPRESELEFFLELVPQGELGQRLFALTRGDRLHVRKVAKGNFTLDEKSGRRMHFMVATVTGVAPFVSMVRTLVRDEEAGKPSAGHRAFLLQGASRSWEFGYDTELAEIEREYRWFRYVPTVSRPREDAAWGGERGRVHELISKYLDRFQCNPTDTTAYLCGHPGMIESGKMILRVAGFEKESIREERFWVAKPSP